MPAARAQLPHAYRWVAWRDTKISCEAWRLCIKQCCVDAGDKIAASADVMFAGGVATVCCWGCSSSARSFEGMAREDSGPPKARRKSRTRVAG
eukprot:s4657_g5.t1